MPQHTLMHFHRKSSRNPIDREDQPGLNIRRAWRRRRRPPTSVVLTALLMASLVSGVDAQTVPTDPDVGLRSNPPRGVVLRGGTVVARPGVRLESADIRLDGPTIVEVAESVKPRPGDKIIDMSGRTIYAGFIDSMAEIDVDEPAGADRHHNGYVMPNRTAATAVDELSDAKTLREQGVTARLVAPKGGLFKGQSVLVLNGSTPEILQPRVASHLQITMPRDQRRDEYPNSPMGATALVRQVLLDARWYRDAQLQSSANQNVSPPQRNMALELLSNSSPQTLHIIDAQNERMLLRAGAIANEFALSAIYRGSGREYRELASITEMQPGLILPVDFPSKPDVTQPTDADNVSLRDLMHWRFAPTNPARLDEAGIRFCLTSHGLDKKSQFLKNVRQAVDRGLDCDTALAALTTRAAELLRIDANIGAIAKGHLANLVVCDGDLFERKTKIEETWVAGKRFEKDESEPSEPDVFPAGTYQAELTIGDSTTELFLSLVVKKHRWSGKLMTRLPSQQDAADEDTNKAKDEDEGAVEDEGEDEPTTSVAIANVVRGPGRLTGSVRLGKIVEGDVAAGTTRFSLITIANDDRQIASQFVLPSGAELRPVWEPVNTPKDMDEDDGENADEDNDEAEPEDQPDGETPSPDDASETAIATDASNDSDGDIAENDTDRNDSESDSATQTASLAVNYPLGSMGTTTKPTQQTVLFRNVTAWTCESDGILESVDVLVRDGKIVEIGKDIAGDSETVVVDGDGKHLTPGIIDCHSHMGTDGGVNESGQAITAEVRIGDFINHTDIDIYRQLAGGVTTANILHGSANPIGGQNQVVKLRWGDSMQSMKFRGAPAGIKFALGENVKRSNRSGRSTRYPSSRIGVREIIRDRLLAARQYMDEHRDWQRGQRDGLPPRTDLELEAITEILRGQRWIHCHSYRQDEIMALLDITDEFQIRIGTLQHILEGYKVADRMRRSGVMASSFADWWAYKFEVYDAIPFNGSVMHDVGITVSFNSDDAELARHLNHEAAKAVKYGGVEPAEALKFVTLNAAIQLRIDDQTGSIAVGKDADLVLWSGDPLSTLSRCEQTWVDGTLRFDIRTDRELRRRDQAWRTELINLCLGDSPDGKDDEGKEDDEKEDSDEDDAGRVSRAYQISEEDRWINYDAYCRLHDRDHGQDNQWQTTSTDANGSQQ